MDTNTSTTLHYSTLYCGLMLAALLVSTTKITTAVIIYELQATSLYECTNVVPSPVKRLIYKETRVWTAVTRKGYNKIFDRDIGKD